MTKTIIDGGHWEKKGYYYRIYFTTPEFICEKVVNIHNRKHTTRKFNANTSFWFTTNSIYVNIGMKVLGLGLGFEIHSRD